MWIESRTDHINDLSNYLTQASLKLNEANNAEKNFVLFETINPRFYRNRESRFYDQHANYIEKSQAYLSAILKYEEADIMGIRGDLKETIAALDSMKHTFTLLVDLYLERGFQDQGLIGDMQEQIRYIEDDSKGIDQAKILKVRKAEKDYLLNKQVIYMSQMNRAVSDLRQELKRIPDSKTQNELIRHLDSYRLNFLKLVRIEEQIGFKEDRGMKHILSQISDVTDQDLIRIEERVYGRTLQLRMRFFWGLLLIGFFFLLLTAGAGVFVLRSLGRPIQSLSDGIGEAIDSQFKADMRLPNLNSKDEIGQIARDVAYLYSRIQAYTAELLQQKEEISSQAENLSQANTDLEEQTEQITAKNFELEHQNEMIAEQRDTIEDSLQNVKLLSQIGQEITNHLRINEIVDTVYEHIQKLMPASVFAIGIYEPDKNILDFYGVEQEKEGIQRAHDEVKNPPKALSDWCFINSKEVCIQNTDVSYIEYVSIKPEVLTSLGSQSVIYLPMVIKGSTIGVLTVHAKSQNAYSSFQLNILRNLASYTAIAIDNAQVYSTLSEQQKLLEAQAEQLQTANQEIGDKNKAIMSSINYAKRMQQTILPNKKNIEQYLPESFVLYMPRDVVSGDFYFFSVVKEKDKELIILAAVDCTGHGVPGAFTSMLGNSILDNIVNQRKITDPGEILNQLHQGISYIFKQQESNNKDGMDMSICTIDLTARKLYFAGAKNPLVYIQDNEMTYVKGTRFSIGGGTLRVQPTFQTHTIDIKKPTTFYIYSDGYQDQFGGANNRKLFSRNFRNILFDLHQEEMEYQREELVSHFVEWTHYGEHKQIDDILVIGAHIE